MCCDKILTHWLSRKRLKGRGVDRLNIKIKVTPERAVDQWKEKLIGGAKHIKIEVCCEQKFTI